MTDQWNQRLRERIFWINDRWEDRVLTWTDRPGVPCADRAYELLIPLGWDHSKRFLCWLRRAHVPIADHCLMPEHDFCARCNKPMPFQAPNVEKRQEYLKQMRARFSRRG
jgi:hypothetical protein